MSQELILYSFFFKVWLWQKECHGSLIKKVHRKQRCLYLKGISKLEILLNTTINHKHYFLRLTMDDIIVLPDMVGGVLVV